MGVVGEGGFLLGVSCLCGDSHDGQGEDHDQSQLEANGEGNIFNGHHSLVYVECSMQYILAWAHQTVMGGPQSKPAGGYQANGEQCNNHSSSVGPQACPNYCLGAPPPQ